MSGRSHDHYCKSCGGWWSPFDFDRCPCGAPEKESVYDLNHEEEKPK